MYRCDVNSSINVWENLLSKMYCDWVFLYWKVFNYIFYSFNNYRTIEIICFILAKFWYFVLFKKQVISSKLSNYLQSCSFYSLTLWQYRSSDFPSFFPDIGHLCLLFSLSVLLEINQFCWSRNQLLVLLIFPNLFPAVFSHWFLLVLLLFPSFCLRWVFTALFPVS